MSTKALIVVSAAVVLGTASAALAMPEGQVNTSLGISTQYTTPAQRQAVRPYTVDEKRAFESQSRIY